MNASPLPSSEYQAAVFHRDLAAFNRRRLSATSHREDWRRQIGDDHAWRVREERFLETERARVAARAARAPADADAFVAWFEALKENGPGQHDPLFPWLAEEASREAMTWFLTQEIAGEAGFDDLVAMTQVKLPTRAKLELARNYWDEMGQGNPSAMHGPMLEALARELGIVSGTNVVWESVALGNLMTGLATNRHYAYESVGALGVVELTAPGRAVHVSAGLKRLRVPGEARRYFALHSTLDVKHSEAWNREVLRPLVAADPDLAEPIAAGALMRMEAGRRCFDRYRDHLRAFAGRRFDSRVRLNVRTLR